jgi:hypothetical protein
MLVEPYRSILPADVVIWLRRNPQIKRLNAAGNREFMSSRNPMSLGGYAALLSDAWYEISSDPLPSGHTSRLWGVGIKRPGDAVTLDPDPWLTAT